MATMDIQFKNSYSGAPAYASGNFDDGEMLGSTWPIYMKDFDATASSWSWSIITAPRGSVAAILNSTSQEASINPDMSGTWLIECVSDVDSKQVYMSVAPFNSAGRMPAREETDEDATYGWAEGQNDLLRSLDGGIQKIFAGEALVYGNIVSWADYGTGPDQPNAYKTGSFAAADRHLQRPLGMCIDTLSTHQRGRAITRGMCLFDVTSMLSGGSAGDTIFVNSSSQLTLTTTEFPVGLIIRTGGSYPGTTLGAIYLDFSGLGLKLEETFIPIEWCEDGTTPPAMTEVLTSGNGSVRIRKFDSTTDEDVIFPWEIPSSMLVENGLMVSVVGYMSEATSSGIAMSFEFERYHIASGGQLGGTFASAINTGIGYITHTQYKRFATTEALLDCSGSSFLPGETMMIKVARDNSVGSNYANDLGVYGFRLRWVARK